MLKAEQTVLLVIDVQGKLAQLMHEKEALFAALKKMVRAAKVLEIPVIWLEQIPDKLGRTVPELAELLEPEYQPIPKSDFSCLNEPAFARQLEALGRKQVLVSGIEAHICIYQTAADLLARGYAVQVLADGVSSRSPENKAVALERIRSLGGAVSSTEMAIFEILKKAQGERFKAIVPIVR